MKVTLSKYSVSRGRVYINIEDLILFWTR